MKSLDHAFMMESIGVRLPTGEVTTLRVAVKYSEDDQEIAQRLAKGFPPGTMLRVDVNRFQVVSQDPPIVEPALSEEPSSIRDSEPPKSDKSPITARIGQRWVTKDSRRKQEPFEIVAIEDGHALTDKGSKIKLDRLSRYRLCS